MPSETNSSHHHCTDCGLPSSESARVFGASLTSNPDVERLLSSNAVPLPSVQGSLTERRTEIELRLAENARRIAQIDVTRARLLEENEALGAEVQLLGTILSPLRRMPLELLTRIFSLANSESEVDVRRGWLPSRRSDNTPLDPLPSWTVSQVCQRWRQVSLSLPRLWSHISLDLDNPDHTREYGRSMALSHRLSRSQDQPLILRINAGNIGPFSPLLSPLFVCSFRWQEVHLLVYRDSFETLSSGIRGGLPALRTLSLAVVAAPSAGHPVCDAFELAPRLTELSLEGDPVSVLDCVRLPWTQIRRFRWPYPQSSFALPLPPPDNSLHLELLSRMPTLERCVIGNVRQSTQGVTLVSVQLPALKALKLRAYAHNHDNGCGIGQFLNHLRAPYLQELDVTGHISQASLDGFCHFLQSNRNTLRAVRLRRPNTTSLSGSCRFCDALISALPASVTTLELDGFNIGFTTPLHRLFFPNILPQLQRFVFRKISIPLAEFQHILAVVESRQPEHDTLFQRDEDLVFAQLADVELSGMSRRLLSPHETRVAALADKGVNFTCASL